MAPSTTDRTDRVAPPRVRTRASQRPRRGPARTPASGWRRHLVRGGSTPGERGGAAARAARATRGVLGLSTARRAAVLALVVCALALTVAVPLRNYVTQRHEIAAVSQERERLSGEVADLAAQRGALSDPARVEALARERLGYARPGETPYRVQLPGAVPSADGADGSGATDGAAAPVEADLPWYARLARETLGGPGIRSDPAGP